MTKVEIFTTNGESLGFVFISRMRDLWIEIERVWGFWGIDTVGKTVAV